MIRPFTLICALLAIGSGFYLYQAKHRTKLLDERIVAVEQRTAATETRISVLRAEWALENAPSRLAELAARYLVLVPMQPDQAVSLAGLGQRLPPEVSPGAESPAVAAEEAPMLADVARSARYASLDVISQSEERAPSSSSRRAPAAAPALAAAAAPAPPAAAAPAAPASPAPPAVAKAIPPVSPNSTQAVRSAAAVEPQPSLPTSRPAPVRDSVLTIAPRAAPVPGVRPSSVLTTALGGSYPSLPPPVPLAGSR